MPSGRRFPQPRKTLMNKICFDWNYAAMAAIYAGYRFGLDKDTLCHLMFALYIVFAARPH
jgi:hypothetical protein